MEKKREGERKGFDRKKWRAEIIGGKVWKRCVIWTGKMCRRIMVKAGSEWLKEVTEE